jgi:hypothetical protein
MIQCITGRLNMNFSTPNKFAVLLLASLTPALANAVPINLLTNAGFETGDFTGWTVGGTSVQSAVDTDGTVIPGTNLAFGTTFQNVRSGTYGANALVRGDPLEQVFFEQAVSVIAGNTYDVGYFAGVDSPTSIVSQYGFGPSSILVDGVALALTQPSDLAIGSTPAMSDWEHVFGNYLAGGTGLVNVSYRIAGSGTGRAGFSFDDMYFTGEAAAVPAPPALILFGFGLAGLGLAKRRIGQAQA